MCPLARPLLALAAAVLIAGAHAQDDTLKRRLSLVRPAACSELSIGATPEQDSFIKKKELERFHVDPPKNSSPKKFEIKIPNIANVSKHEVLVGQRILVCDIQNPDNTVDVKKGISDLQYSPLTVTCTKGCPQGVEVVADQFIIKRLI